VAICLEQETSSLLRFVDFLHIHAKNLHYRAALAVCKVQKFTFVNFYAIYARSATTASIAKLHALFHSTTALSYRWHSARKRYRQTLLPGQGAATTFFIQQQPSLTDGTVPINDTGVCYQNHGTIRFCARA
jgi:hypothetical protein